MSILWALEGECALLASSLRCPPTTRERWAPLMHYKNADPKIEDLFNISKLVIDSVLYSNRQPI
jgi:hypothetical protein